MNKKTFAYMVDGRPYTTHDQYITGREIKNQASVPADYLLYLTHKHAVDELIEDGKQIDLAMPAIEKFITKAPSQRDQIIINNVYVDYDAETISYVKVLEMNPKGYDPSHEYSVVYFDGPYQNPSGEMNPGDILYVKNKMRFNVEGSHRS